MTKQWLYVAVLAIALVCGPANADVWDTAAESDDGHGTDNSLAHGTVQVHDLGVRPGLVADADWYRVTVPPYSSFEVQIDGFTGDLNLGQSNLERLYPDSNGDFFVHQSSRSVNGEELVRRISWINSTDESETSHIRVRSPACGTSCTASDQYTIRARETSIAVARFNNSASQATILLAQNSSNVDINLRIYFWSPTGVLLHTLIPTILGSKALLVSNTSTLPLVSGQSGSITIAHNGPHWGLNVKAVSLEPSTGFSFDTPGVIRP